VPKNSVEKTPTPFVTEINSPTWALEIEKCCWRMDDIAPTAPRSAPSSPSAIASRQITRNRSGFPTRSEAQLTALAHPFMPFLC
jgi:hypothetical protein